MKDKILKIIIQFIKFGVVGLSNTIISYLIYALLTYIGMSYVLANIIGFVISVLNSFYWNNKYVFKEGSQNRNLLNSLLKTFVAYGSTGLILNNILLILLVEYFEISKYFAPILVLIVTIPLNFVINKYWSFKTSDRKEKNG